jgi:hypothetical protein
MLIMQNTQDFIDTQTHADVPAAPDTLLTQVINRLVVECQRIESSKPSGKSGPGSEYCNHAGTAGSVIHKHEKNPDGILCANCGKKSHDTAHCFAKRGRMEGQGPKPKPKPKVRPEVAAIASGSSMSSAPTGSTSTYIGDLSCTTMETPSIDDFTGLLSASGGFASILDSGTSSHLLKDRDVFWTYEVAQARPMKTANHGVLLTKASGDCLVHLSMGGVSTVIKLRDCLHAPSACINLLSVGRMTASGSKVCCIMDDGKFSLMKKGADGSRSNNTKGNHPTTCTSWISSSFGLLLSSWPKQLSSPR